MWSVRRARGRQEFASAEWMRVRRIFCRAASISTINVFVKYLTKKSSLCQTSWQARLDSSGRARWGTPSCVAAGSIGIITSIISIEVTTMIREAPAMTVRQNLGDLLSEVQYRKGKVIITKAGKPVAALVDIALFERIRKLDEEFDQMREEFARAFAGVPEKRVEALVDEAVKEARARRRRK